MRARACEPLPSLPALQPGADPRTCRRHRDIDSGCCSTGYCGSAGAADQQRARNRIGQVELMCVWQRLPGPTPMALSPDWPGNRLLLALPAADLKRLTPALKRVECKREQIL